MAVFVLAPQTQGASQFTPQAAAACIAPPSGLVGWWPGDSNENDIVGGNNPSSVSAVSLVPAEVLDGFSFGAKGYIEVPSSSTLANQTFTWAAWVRPDGPGPNNDAFGSYIFENNINGATDAVSLTWSATNHQFFFIFGATATQFVASNDTFAPGSFYFVAATYDGSVFRLFVNGILEGSRSLSKTIAYSSSGWTFGSSIPTAISAGFARTWNGVIDEIQAFNRALSPSELQSIFNAAGAGECKASAATANSILPQLALGGGWSTALYFTNVTSAPVSFTVNFIGGDGAALGIPALNGSSADVNLAARGTAIIEAPNTGSLVEGYVAAALPAGVTGYGVFRYAPQGPGQEAVVPLSGVTATTSTMIFDETGYTTGVAVVALSSAAVTVNVTAYGADGSTIGTGSIQLPANGKTALLLKDIPGLSGVAGQRGSVDFSVTSGNVAALGIRYNGLAFTSIPTSDR